MASTRSSARSATSRSGMIPMDKGRDKEPAKSRSTSRPSRVKGAQSKHAKLEKESEDTGDEGSAKENVDEDDSEDLSSLDSEALDDDDILARPTKTATRKRKRSTNSSPNKAVGVGKKGRTPRKRQKGGDEDEDEGDDFELKEGQEIVGVVVQAPKTGRVPPGQISKNTMEFLSQLKKPECNDREWFRLHEPVYRLAEKEWKDFIEAFTDVIAENDPQVPHLPPKDVIHRIYRDVRFSNDKTPYKTGLSASFSRSGRKGIFAGYHLSVRPGGQSLIGAGSWQPGRNEIQTIRSNLLRSSARLRQVISSPKFVEVFGEAKPHPEGQRQNIFGSEDELKVSPKGIEKTHKDIDLLKCRSFAVFHRFTDEEVLDPNFRDVLGRFVKILRPFVHCINDLMTIQPDSDTSDEGEESDVEDEN